MCGRQLVARKPCLSARRDLETPRIRALSLTDTEEGESYGYRTGMIVLTDLIRSGSQPSVRLRARVVTAPALLLQGIRGQFIDSAARGYYGMNSLALCVP